VREHSNWASEAENGRERESRGDGVRDIERIQVTATIAVRTPIPVKCT
jgi:hypothetical protein